MGKKADKAAQRLQDALDRAARVRAALRVLGRQRHYRSELERHGAGPGCGEPFLQVYSADHKVIGLRCTGCGTSADLDGLPAHGFYEQGAAPAPAAIAPPGVTRLLQSMLPLVVLGQAALAGPPVEPPPPPRLALGDAPIDAALGGGLRPGELVGVVVAGLFVLWLQALRERWERAGHQVLRPRGDWPAAPAGPVLVDLRGEAVDADRLARFQALARRDRVPALVFLDPLQEQAALEALPCVLRLQGGVLSITQRTTCGAEGAR